MRKITLLLTSIVLAVILAGGVALAASAGTKNPGNAEARDAALDASLKALVAMRGGPPGVIAIVQRGKDREVHAFGVRNLKRDLPMRPDAHMRQASTSKAFNGALALALVDEGELSLNDTVTNSGALVRPSGMKPASKNRFSTRSVAVFGFVDDQREP